MKQKLGTIIGDTMKDRAYILLDILNGKAEQVAQSLKRNKGVVSVDVLEGPPDIIIILEASGRQKLAELTIQALASVESVTENMKLLPAQ